MGYKSLGCASVPPPVFSRGACNYWARTTHAASRAISYLLSWAVAVGPEAFCPHELVERSVSTESHQWKEKILSLSHATNSSEIHSLWALLRAPPPEKLECCVYEEGPFVVTRDVYFGARGRVAGTLQVRLAGHLSKMLIERSRVPMRRNTPPDPGVKRPGPSPRGDKYWRYLKQTPGFFFTHFRKLGRKKSGQK